MPAFMTAVAASECGEDADMVRAADGEWVREVEVPLEAEGDACGEGGRVFRSGGMAAVGVV